MANEQKPKKKRDRTEYQRQYYLKRRAELLERHKEWSKQNGTEAKRKYRAKLRQSKTPGELLDALDAIKPESE